VDVGLLGRLFSIVVWVFLMCFGLFVVFCFVCDWILYVSDCCYGVVWMVVGLWGYWLIVALGDYCWFC